MFAVEVDSRDRETIKKIFQKHVLPGSIVLTDRCKTYGKVCDELQLAHYTVNHSKKYKDPLTGTHTNTIEDTNNGLKTCIKPRNRVKKNIKYYLLYCISRRQNKMNKWQGLLNALKKINYR